jgi:hypothetical protein
VLQLPFHGASDASLSPLPADATSMTDYSASSGSSEIQSYSSSPNAVTQNDSSPLPSVIKSVEVKSSPSSQGCDNGIVCNGARSRMV